MNPSVLARTDQAHAATAHATSTLERMAALPGYSSEHRIPGPVMSQRIRAVRLRLIGGQLEPCEHLSSPAPSFWFASDAHRLRCAECLSEVTEAVRGTRADHQCDACGRVSRGVTVTAALVNDAPSYSQFAGYPLILSIGMCEPCRRKDRRKQ